MKKKVTLTVEIELNTEMKYEQLKDEIQFIIGDCIPSVSDDGLILFNSVSTSCVEIKPLPAN